MTRYALALLVALPFWQVTAAAIVGIVAGFALGFCYGMLAQKAIDAWKRGKDWWKP